MGTHAHLDCVLNFPSPPGIHTDYEKLVNQDDPNLSHNKPTTNPTNTTTAAISMQRLPHVHMSRLRLRGGLWLGLAGRWLSPREEEHWA